LFGLKNYMNKKIVWGVVGIVVLVAVFYGGMIYGKSQTSANVAGGAASTYGGGTRGTRGALGFGGGANGGAAFGQIISKDATSITVQLATPTAGSTSQSGSKIILLDPSTKITKQTSGALSDLAVGTNVSVTGTANTDGSISATSVQIRPAGTGAPRTPSTPSTNTPQ
jgi:hypothetical protein